MVKLIKSKHHKFSNIRCFEQVAYHPLQSGELIILSVNVLFLEPDQML